MNDQFDNNNPRSPETFNNTLLAADANNKLKTFCWIAYILLGLGFITSGLLAFAPIAAIILIYIKRSDAAGTIYAAHFDWMLSTFFWGLLWVVLSYIFIFVLIGWVTLAAALIWVLYRLIRGIVALVDNRAP